MNQEFLRGTAHHFFEFSAEMITVQFAKASFLINGQFTVIVLLNINDGFIDIKILLFFFRRSLRLEENSINSSRNRYNCPIRWMEDFAEFS